MFNCTDYIKHNMLDLKCDKSRKYYNVGIIFMLWNFIVKLEY